MRREIEALAGYLDASDYDFFSTFTTRKPMGLHSARKIAERVAGAIDAGRTTEMFWAAEKFELKEGAGANRFHFHALIKTHGQPITPKGIFAWYFPRYGRCQIINNTDPDRRQAASWYCAKYVTEELADYDIYVPGMQNPPAQMRIF